MPAKSDSTKGAGRDAEAGLLDVIGGLQAAAGSRSPVSLLQQLDDGRLQRTAFDFAHALQLAESSADRTVLLDYHQEHAYSTLMRLVLGDLCSEKDATRFLLLTFDLLEEEGQRAENFSTAEPDAWKQYLTLLENPQPLVRNTASRVVARLLIGQKNNPPKPEDIRPYLSWLKCELRQDNVYLQSVARCLQTILRRDEYRLELMSMNAMSHLVRLLTCDIPPQTQYQLVFCVWLVSFNPYLAEKMLGVGTVPVLCEVLKCCHAENRKLPRVVLATFRNLLQKPQERLARRRAALLLVRCRLRAYLALIQARIALDKGPDPEYRDDFQSRGNNDLPRL